MPCYRPLTGYRSRFKGKSGKRPIVFSAAEGFIDQPVTVPCGKCIGCRLEQSRQWALRCVHEASLYDENCFITLTYDEAHCPGELRKADFQKFMKRLRKRYGKVRFFHCGEYGGLNGRPHFHALLFGFDFRDKLLAGGREGAEWYISDSLRELWPFGFSSVGAVTFESAAYVARYVVKKQEAVANNELLFETGEVLPRASEYVTMSRRPGIGREWIDRFAEDTYKDDFCVVQGQRMKPARYYDNQLEDAQLEKIKKKRQRFRDEENSTVERLATREKVKKAQIRSLRRSLR